MIVKTLPVNMVEVVTMELTITHVHVGRATLVNIVEQVCTFQSHCFSAHFLRSFGLAPHFLRGGSMETTHTSYQSDFVIFMLSTQYDTYIYCSTIL